MHQFQVVFVSTSQGDDSLKLITSNASGHEISTGGSRVTSQQSSIGGPWEKNLRNGEVDGGVPINGRKKMGNWGYHPLYLSITYIIIQIISKKESNEASLRSLLFENLRKHPKMALAVDKFRQAAMGSRKRTSQWLHERLREAIDISQMDTNTTSVDKALALGGDSKIQIGAQADPKKPA